VSPAEHHYGRETGDANPRRGCPMNKPVVELSLDKRREILLREIAGYVKKGYRVLSQTDTTAQLVKPKRFSCFWAIVGILIIYLIWYWSRKDLLVYLSIDPSGKVTATKNTSMGLVGTKVK
jgi:hypothetical protein